MPIRESVFGRRPEERLFSSLRARWGAHLDIFPSLPFCQIVDIAQLSVNRQERELLFKSSVDYTLCEAGGRPVASIEFDGLCGGFSRRGRYVASVVRSDRARKLDLKLRLAAEANEPGTPLHPIEARIAALSAAKRVGHRGTVGTVFGDVTADAWIRNIDGPFFSPLTIVGNIALLWAATRALYLGRRRRITESNTRARGKADARQG